MYSFVDSSCKPQTFDSITTVDPIKVTCPTVLPDRNTTESANAAKEHIKSIRQGLGVDSDSNQENRSIISHLHGVLQRSLEKLSTDIYSEQGHFMLELIQNADDNHYGLSVRPELRFILSSERILVCNNELGFQESHIDAICNVGTSTKGKHKQGYAGHKGIGFKSVFMVSHRPEIHSGHYHIRFDTDNGKKQMGYILPTWLDEYEEALPESEQWTTSIRLPIKSDTCITSVRQKFDNLEGKLLLFLNRLRQIEIIDEDNLTSSHSSNRVFSRTDHADGQIIELHEKISSERINNEIWLVIKQVIDVPQQLKVNIEQNICSNVVDYTRLIDFRKVYVMSKELSIERLLP
jgi:hypothetical protein